MLELWGMSVEICSTARPPTKTHQLPCTEGGAGADGRRESPRPRLAHQFRAFQSGRTALEVGTRGRRLPLFARRYTGRRESSIREDFGAPTGVLGFPLADQPCDSAAVRLLAKRDERDDVNERLAPLLGEKVACANEAKEVAHVRLVTDPDPYRRKPRASIIPRWRAPKPRRSDEIRIDRRRAREDSNLRPAD
jgi:hypothetical protein